MIQLCGSRQSPSLLHFNVHREEGSDFKLYSAHTVIPTFVARVRWPISGEDARRGLQTSISLESAKIGCSWLVVEVLAVVWGKQYFRLQSGLWSEYLVEGAPCLTALVLSSWSVNCIPVVFQVRCSSGVPWLCPEIYVCKCRRRFLDCWYGDIYPWGWYGTLNLYIRSPGLWL